MLDNIEFAYEPVEMWKADGEFTYAREPVLRRMPDGSLLSLIYTGGPREPSRENVAAVIRSRDDGATWSYPEILFRHPRRPTWPTELFTETERPFTVFQTFNIDCNYCELRSFLSYTDDSGKTWSEPVSFAGVPSNFSARQCKVLSDGTWLLPVYWMEVRGNWTLEAPYIAEGWYFVSGVLRSSDRGGSWSLHGALSCGKKLLSWEPEVVELTPGHLRMFIRCESPEHVLWESDSLDFGKTWSAPVPGSISNPGTKVVVYKVGDRLVMVNNTCGREHPDRNSLELLISSDAGKNWSRRLPLARLHRSGNPWDGFFDAGAALPQVAYPHGFADDREEKLYLAIDSVRKFFLVKVPYKDILG
ncbi:MAG: Sialidase precursor [Lentisphaerae bacterium ADurb.Bin242]|nr:MAG: Sialidase precursor [Lentisphaerae bacterium ADurb.Bin242]